MVANTAAGHDLGRARPRAAGVALGVGVLVAALATTPTASADLSAVSAVAAEKRVPTKTRLLDALLRGESPTPPAKAAARAAGDDRPLPQVQTPFADGADAADARTASADAGCEAPSLDWTIGHDRVDLFWDAAAPSPYRIERQRAGGAVQALATDHVNEVLTDGAIGTQGFVSYAVTAADGSSCATPELTMSTEDGYGEPEAAVGTVDPNGVHLAGVLLQDTWSLGEFTNLEGVDPSFSPDGRRIVTSVEVSATTRVLSVQRVASRTELSRFAAPEDTIALDPEWSPDASRIAYTRYTVDPATADVTAVELRVLDVATGADRTVAGSTGLMQPDWVSNTLLVAAGADAGSGLSYIPAAGGTPAPIADTENAMSPDLGAQSARIWFATDDGTTSRINAVVRLANDQVGTVRESTSVVYDQPRTTERDGNVESTPRRYHVEFGLGTDPADPADDTFVIVEDDFANAPRDTPVGVPRHAGYAAWGYDLRRPPSKGTSDLTGDGHGDILARDSSGNVWVYPYTPAAAAGARVLLGKGWGIYDTFLVAGDLTGDGRADIVARDRSGVLWRYDGRGAAKVAPRVRIGTGWGGYLLVAPGDWDGNGFGDLIARSASGELWRYPAVGRGTLGPRQRLGTGWNSMNAVLGSGDFDLDGDPDLLAREAATGALWLYPGTGNGRFSPRRRVGSGWNVFTQLSGPEVLSGSPAVHAVTPTGELLLYRVVGDGRFDGDEVYRIGRGWSSYTVAP